MKKLLKYEENEENDSKMTKQNLIEELQNLKQEKEELINNMKIINNENYKLKEDNKKYLEKYKKYKELSKKLNNKMEILNINIEELKTRDNFINSPQYLKMLDIINSKDKEINILQNKIKINSINESIHNSTNLTNECKNLRESLNLIKMYLNDGMNSFLSNINQLYNIIIQV